MTLWQARFEQLEYRDINHVLKLAEPHIVRHVSDIHDDPHTGRSAKLKSFFDDYCVKPKNESHLIRSLGTSRFVTAIVGRGGSGKTTFVEKFVQALDDGTTFPNQRLGHVRIDFGLSEERLGFDAKRLPSGPEAGDLIKQAVRNAIKSQYLSTGETRRKFEHWLRGQFVAQRRLGQEAPMERLIVNVRPHIEDLIAETRKDLEPWNDEHYGKFVRDVDDLPLRKLFRDRVDPEIKSRHFIRFLLDEMKYDGFFVIFDNVDLLPHASQQRCAGILDRIVDGTDRRAVGIISIRAENVQDVAPYTNYGEIPLKRLESIDPETEEHYPIEVPSIEVDPEEPEPANENCQSTSREGLVKRFNLAVRLIDAGLTPPERAAADFVKVLLRGIVDTYLETQIFRLSNESLRLHNELHLRLLDYSCQHHLPLLKRELKTGSEFTKVLTSVFYCFLADDYANPPFRPVDYVQSIRNPDPAPVKCFLEHLILAYLLNAKIRAEERKRRLHFVPSRELIAKLTPFNYAPEAIVRTLHDLAGEDTSGHLLDLRLSPSSTLNGPHEYEIWITPRGEETVVNLPYRFFFVLKQISQSGKRRFNPWELSRDEQATLYYKFMIDLMEFHLEGLRRVRAAYPTLPTDGWVPAYLRDFGIPRPDSSRKLFQIDRYASNANLYLEIGGEALGETKFDELRRTFHARLANIR